MHKYVYGQGYTIREKKSNWYGEHNMLKVNKDGSCTFLKYWSKSAGTPWGRFLNKRDAELFMLKNKLDSKDYELVKAKHPKYMELVDEESGLYKLVSEDDYNLKTFGKDKVKYFDETGTQQSTPVIPATVKKSNSGVAWYILKEAVNYWGNLISKYILNFDYNGYNLSLKFRERSSYNRAGGKVPNTFYVVMFSELSKDNDDLSPLIDLILDLAHYKTEVTRGFTTVGALNKKLVWQTAINMPFKDILCFPRLDIDYDNLTKLSDEQIFNLKQFINENRDVLYTSIIKSKLDDNANELKGLVDKQIPKIKDYFNTEIFENLSLKEIFNKIYEDK